MYTGNYLGDNYNPYEYASESTSHDLYHRLESEPINVKGAIGILTIVIGILLWKS